MIGKLAVACLAAPILSSASMPEAVTLTYHASVVKVSCKEGTGSAFRIGSGALVSVNHVTANTDCRVGDRPIEVTYADSYLDFSVARFPGDGPLAKVNCEGFKDGEIYFAIGHARGGPQRLVTVRYSETATKAYGFNGMAVLYGAEHFIPGMSGAAVFNLAGEAVGLVNAFNPFLILSFSRALKDTPLCA